MRSVFFAALIAGVVLIPTALGLERARRGAALENYFARARAVILLTASSPAFANVLAEPGTRADKVAQMAYLETFYPHG